MKKISQEELLNRANKIHNFKYVYNFDNYKTIKDKILIKCPIHDVFIQTMEDHINGHGCPLCAIEKNSKGKRNNLQDLIDRANVVHDNKYDYSNLNSHKSMHDKVSIICPRHGIFQVPLHWHINKGRGCPECALDDRRDTNTEFIEKANKVHNNKYDYSKVIYFNTRTKVIITCPKHGDFLQKPQDHLFSKAGCPICKESKGERFISQLLQSYNINYTPQKSFDDLKHKKLLYYDFYLPELNVCIEYDGEQHFKPILYWGDEKAFKELQLKDKLKNEYCISNNIPLLRLTYKDSDSDVKSKILNFLQIKESHFITKFSKFI